MSVALAGDCWHYLGRYDLVSDSFSKAGSLQSVLEARMTQGTYCKRSIDAAVVEIGAANPLCVHHDPQAQLLLRILRGSVEDSGRKARCPAKKRRVRIAKPGNKQY